MRTLILAVGLASALVACNEPYPNLSIEDTYFAPVLGVNLKAMTKTPSGMYYADVQSGSGAVVEVGKTVTVHYDINTSGGQLLERRDPSLPAPSNVPLVFKVGAGEVLKGWDEGLLGMRAGGWRQMVWAPKHAYGDLQVGDIPPHSVLVVNARLLSVE
jgi:FKBP-type peptidyl-prolyl cis-trans isomerase